VLVLDDHQRVDHDHADVDRPDREQPAVERRAVREASRGVVAAASRAHNMELRMKTSDRTDSTGRDRPILDESPPAS
jgi:hypothetical protein